MNKAVPSRTTMAKTFDGPPTLERSGSEHRVGRFTSFLLRRKAWLEVELPLERETEGFESTFLNSKEGRDDFRKKRKKKKHYIMMNDFKDIKVAVAGTGYVGLSIATLLSQHHHVSSRCNS